MQGQTLQGLISRKCLIDDGNTALNAVLHFLPMQKCMLWLKRKLRAAKNNKATNTFLISPPNSGLLFPHLLFSILLAVIVLYYFLPFNRHHIPALVCQRDGSWVIHQRDTAQQNNPWVYCILIRAKKRDSIEAPLTYTVKVVLSYYYYQEAESRGKSLWNCSCQNAEKQ